MIEKPLASLSLDLDNQWSYMKTHGDAGWDTYPSYLELLIPFVLDILDSLNLKITFFIVGQDAALDKNRDCLKLITERGHEVGNHSFHHQQWLHLYSKEELRAEVVEAEQHIVRATGKKPEGFRGPGFGWSPDLLEILAERGYVYDTSTFPTFLRPLVKAYYSRISDLNEEEKERINEIHGGFKEGLRPLKPYRWKLSNGKMLLEIPVSTIPMIKTPFHMSYLLYLSRFSDRLMTAYLRLALHLCRVTRTGPSFLLHSTDFLDSTQVPELAFFPGMDIPRSKKVRLIEQTIQAIGRRYTLANMSSFARSLNSRNDLKTYSPYPKRAFED